MLLIICTINLHYTIMPHYPRLHHVPFMFALKLLEQDIHVISRMEEYERQGARMPEISVVCCMMCLPHVIKVISSSKLMEITYLIQAF